MAVPSSWIRTVHRGEWLAIRFKEIISPHPHGQVNRSHFGLPTGPTNTNFPVSIAFNGSTEDSRCTSPAKRSLRLRRRHCHNVIRKCHI
jgi:hypothetical protein